MKTLCFFVCFLGSILCLSACDKASGGAASADTESGPPEDAVSALDQVGDVGSTVDADVGKDSQMSVEAECEAFGLQLIAEPFLGVHPLDVIFSVKLTALDGSPRLDWDFGDGTTGFSGGADDVYTVVSVVEAEIDLMATRGLAADGEGGVFILREPADSLFSNGDVVYRVDMSGAIVAQHEWPKGNEYKSLAWDGTTFWASRSIDGGSSCPCTIERLSTEGVVSTTIDDGISKFIPARLTWGDGSLWVSAGDSVSISRYSGTGALQGTLSPNLGEYDRIAAITHDGIHLLVLPKKGLDLADVVLVLEPDSGELVDSFELPPEAKGDLIAHDGASLFVCHDKMLQELQLPSEPLLEVEHTYQEVGTYLANLEVTDGAGERCMAEITITARCAVDEGYCDGNIAYFCNDNGEFTVEECAEDETCTEGRCSCLSEDHKGCHEGDVYWFDSCGNPGELVEACGSDQACSDGYCLTDCTLECGYSWGLGEAAAVLKCGPDDMCTNMDVVGGGITQNPWSDCYVSLDGVFGGISSLDCSAAPYSLSCDFGFDSGGAIKSMHCTYNGYGYVVYCESSIPSECL